MEAGFFVETGFLYCLIIRGGFCSSALSNYVEKCDIFSQEKNPVLYTL